MDPITAAAVVAGTTQAAQATGGIFTARANRRFARQEAEKAYQRSLEAWHLANAYNSPAAQMARYREAGLNPNLIYGQGTPGNASSSAPSYSPARSEFPNPLGSLGEGLGQFTNLAQTKVQRDKLHAEINAIDQRTRNEAIRGLLLGTELKQRNQDFDLSKEMYDYNLQIKEMEARRAGIGVSLDKQKLANLEQEGKLRLSQTEKTELEKEFQLMKNELMKVGISTSDDVRLRMGYILWQKKGGELMDWVKSILGFESPNLIR